MNTVNFGVEDSDKVDIVLDVVNNINEKLSKLEIKPKKTSSRKLPEDFNYSLIDNFIINYFENNKGQAIKLNELFELFKNETSSEDRQSIPSIKYQFEKRCKNLCETSFVIFKLKE